MRAPDARDDRGTVLVLLLGLTGVLLLMVAVVVNVSAVVLAKRGVASAADGAALAAAQELDLAGLYEDGLGARIPLDPPRVASVVEVFEDRADDAQPGLDLSGRVEQGTTAVVVGARLVRLPLGEALGLRPVRVEAVARAQSPTVP